MVKTCCGRPLLDVTLCSDAREVLMCALNPSHKFWGRRFGGLHQTGLFSDGLHYAFDRIEDAKTGSRITAEELKALGR